MAAGLAQFFLLQAQHLRDGRFDLLVRPYRVPLVIHLPQGHREVTLMTHREDIERFFRAKFEGLAAAGITYLRASTDVIQMLSPERAVTRVTWYYLDASGDRAGQTVADYFIERRTRGFEVKSIDFAKLGFPVIADWVKENGSALTHMPEARFLH